MHQKFRSVVDPNRCANECNFLNDYFTRKGFLFLHSFVPTEIFVCVCIYNMYIVYALLRAFVLVLNFFFSFCFLQLMQNQQSKAKQMNDVHSIISMTRNPFIINSSNSNTNSTTCKVFEIQTKITCSSLFTIFSIMFKCFQLN